MTLIAGDNLNTDSSLKNCRNSSGNRPQSRVAVVIATLGRPEIVTSTLLYLLTTQSLKPVATIVSCAVREDAGNAADFPDVTVVTGLRGLAAQRNKALAALPADIDIVAFFDDDFVVGANWLRSATDIFCEDARVVGITGYVVADGIKGPGLSYDNAVSILESYEPTSEGSRIDSFSPYGCNMAFRVSAIGDLRFDERLVLYGWLEDRDFGASLAKRGGMLIKCTSACGVHMGVKSGRVAGDRLGYSQVVNPIYMMRKGTMTGRQVAGQIFRNVASNLVGAAKRNSIVDRKGRLRGNWRGFIDVMSGHVEPERAADINRSNESIEARSPSISR